MLGGTSLNTVQCARAAGIFCVRTALWPWVCCARCPIFSHRSPCARYDIIRALVLCAHWEEVSTRGPQHFDVTASDPVAAPGERTYARRQYVSHQSSSGLCAMAVYHDRFPPSHVAASYDSGARRPGTVSQPVCTCFFHWSGQVRSSISRNTRGGCALIAGLRFHPSVGPLAHALCVQGAGGGAVKWSPMRCNSSKLRST